MYRESDAKLTNVSNWNRTKDQVEKSRDTQTQ